MTTVRVIPFLASELLLPPEQRAIRGVEWWPSYAHAVVHAGGVFLFDNGAGTGDPEVASTFSPRVTPLGEALAAVGISLGDVTAAANCHLHFDHAGQNWLLRGIPIFVQRPEWAMVHVPDYTVPGWIDVAGLTYELVDGEAEVGPGLRLLPTPGHSPGHQSLVLDTDDGSVILAGQAVLTPDEWDGATDPASSGHPGAPDPDAYAASVRRLRELDPARVHFAHHPSIWERGAVGRPMG